MSKVNTIRVWNYKAIESQNIDLNGCSCIVTARNDAGKSSLLKGMFERMAGNKAAKIVRNGETEGGYELGLDTGERLLWQFSEGEKGFKEKLTYITEKDIKISLTTELRNRFAPATFDVDEFLVSTPAAQRKTLQDLTGLDFTSIDGRYDTAYKERNAANTRASDAKTLFDAQIAPAKVEMVVMTDLTTKKEAEHTRLNDLYTENKNKNTATRLAAEEVNKKLDDLNLLISASQNALSVLNKCGYDGNEVELFIDKLIKLVKPKIVLVDMEVSPEYIPKDGEPILIKERPDDTILKAIDQEIIDATETNRKAKVYTDWLLLQTNVTTTKNLALEADKKVQAITQERLDLIKTANMPEGFAFTDDSITYNGLAFTREQLSSSGIYIAALKLASMKIGEIRCLHFDASFLDNKSLSEIEAWASTQDLQLLIEQPDREGGEITYELLA